MKKSYKVKRKEKKINTGNCGADDGDSCSDITIQKREQSVTVQNDNEWEPTPQQIEVVRLLASLNERVSITEACNRVGVSRMAWYRWKENDNFRRYFRKILSIETEVESVVEAWYCLHKAAKRGNVFAATKILEITGMFTPKIKHELSGDPDNPIKAEIFVPQFNMPPPPQKRDRSGELEVIDVEPLPAADPKTFEQSLLDEEQDDEDI